MKTHRTMQTMHTETLVYEPITAKVADPAVQLSDVIKLMVQLTTEPAPPELPVIA
jgi:hypothetical protein